jgi:hypothetical protein
MLFMQFGKKIKVAEEKRFYISKKEGHPLACPEK